MTKSGFTFIELLVSISILLLFSGLLIAGYSRYNGTQSLAQAAATLTSNLEIARTNAKYGVTPAGCDSLVGYEVDFPSSTSYKVTALCEVSGSQQEVGTPSFYSLASGVAFTPVPSPVIFLTLGQGVAAQTSLVLSGNGNTTTVFISQSGAIADVVFIPPTPTPLPPNSNAGLLGEYFDDQNLTLSVGTRVDPWINYYWGTSKPFSGLYSNLTYSVRWTGNITVPVTGQYTFTLLHDDGAQLWVNNLSSPLINHWVNGANTDSATTGTLTAHVPYPLKLQFYHVSGVAEIIMYWQDGTVVPKAIVPVSALTQD